MIQLIDYDVMVLWIKPKSELLPCISLSFMSLSKTTPLPIKNDFLQQVIPRRRVSILQNSQLCSLEYTVSLHTVIY